MGHVVHYGTGDELLRGEEPVRAYCSDEPGDVSGCDNCMELVAEDLTDENDYQGRCLHCWEMINLGAASGGAGPSAARACTAGKQGWLLR